MEHTPGDPLLVSMAASYYKEQEYIRFRGEYLNSFWDIRLFMKWRGGEYPWGTLWNPLTKLHIHIYHIPKFQNNPSSGYWELIWTKFGWFSACPLGPFESTILNFETLLQNFISISITFQFQNNSSSNYLEVVRTEFGWKQKEKD